MTGRNFKTLNSVQLSLWKKIVLGSRCTRHFIIDARLYRGYIFAYRTTREIIPGVYFCIPYDTRNYTPWCVAILSLTRVNSEIYFSLPKKFSHIFNCHIGYFSFISYCFSSLLYEYCFILHM